MVKSLKRFIENLENSRVSLFGFLIALFCIIFLRNFLETFSDLDNFWTPVSSIAYFIHYPLFYLCLLLALAMIMHWFTGEKIERISKIILFFFPLILLPPVLDLLLSRGQGYNISYLYGDLPSLIHRFITFSWGYPPQGITPGIRIELILAFVLIGFYLFLKTGRVILAIVGIIISYIIGFILGSLPSIITILWNLRGSVIAPETLFSADVVLYHFYSFNHKIALVLYPILLAELGLWYWCYDRQKLLALVKNLRGLRVLHYLCMLGFGMLLGYTHMQPVALLASPFPLLILCVSACSGVLAWLCAVGINDIHDAETDKITNPSRPLVSGIFNADEYRALNLIFLLLSLVTTVLLRYPFFVVMLLAVVLSIIYSAPPFRAKRVPILSTFILALCSALVCLGGFVLFSNNYSFQGFPPRILFTILVALTLGLTIIDIKDLRGDQATGTFTIPTLFGEKNGKKIIGGLVLLAYLSAPLILKSFVLLPFAFIFGISSYFLINQKNMRETPVFVLYFLFLGITLYYLYPQLQGE